MATMQEGNTYTFKAAASIVTTDTTDTVGKMYSAVYIDTAGRVALPTSTSVPCVGILQSNPRAVDEVVRVQTTGKSFCIVGTGGFTPGIALMGNTDGSLILATGTGATAKPIIGTALATDSGAGDISEVLLDNKGPCLGLAAGAPVIHPVRIALNTLLGSDGAMVTGIPVPSTGTITGMYAVIDQPCSVAGKSGTLTLTSSVGTVTAGVLSLTSANCGQASAVAAIAATTPGGAGVSVTSTSTLGLTWAHSTAFTAQDTGAIWVFFVTSL